MDHPSSGQLRPALAARFQRSRDGAGLCSPPWTRKKCSAACPGRLHVLEAGTILGLPTQKLAL